MVRSGLAVSEDFKFRYCHKITKLERGKIPDDAMIFVEKPQEHQIGRKLKVSQRRYMLPESVKYFIFSPSYAIINSFVVRNVLQNLVD